MLRAARCLIGIFAIDLTDQQNIDIVGRWSGLAAVSRGPGTEERDLDGPQPGEFLGNDRCRSKSGQQKVRQSTHDVACGVRSQQSRPPYGTRLDQAGSFEPIDLSMQSGYRDVDPLREFGDAVVLIWV